MRIARKELQRYANEPASHENAPSTIVEKTQADKVNVGMHAMRRVNAARLK